MTDRKTAFRLYAAAYRDYGAWQALAPQAESLPMLGPWEPADHACLKAWAASIGGFLLGVDALCDALEVKRTSYSTGDFYECAKVIQGMTA